MDLASGLRFQGVMRPGFVGVALCLSSLATDAAYAQAANRGLGERSRASIRISVSVAPVLRKETGPAQPHAAGPPALGAFDPGFRYTLVNQPIRRASSREAQQGESDGRMLVLVVPD